MKSEYSILDHVTINTIRSGFLKANSSWSPNLTFPEHRIYFITNGSAILKSKEKSIKLEPRNIYLIPGYYLTNAYCEIMFEHYFVHFEMSSTHMRGIIDFLLQYKQIPVISFDKTTEDFENIIKFDKQTRNLNTYYKYQSSLMSLISMFFNDESIIDFKNIPFTKSLEYIENNLTTDIKLSTLAKLENLSDVYYSNKFSNKFGIPPRQYIIYKKLELAQSLLRNTNKTVSQISLEIGVNDRYYFSKLFSKKFGITPIEYRKRTTNI